MEFVYCLHDKNTVAEKAVIVMPIHNLQSESRTRSNGILRFFFLFSV